MKKKPALTSDESLSSDRGSVTLPLYVIMKSLFSLCACALFVILIQESNAQQLVAGYKARVLGTPYHRITGDGQGNSLVYSNFDHIDGKYVGRLAKIMSAGNIDPAFKKLFADAPIDFVRFNPITRFSFPVDFVRSMGLP